MNKKTYVFIGRFQPWHIGHQQVAEYALSQSNKLIILIGSVDQATDFKNPFTFEQRKLCIEESLQEIQAKYLSKQEYKEILVLPVKDYIYNNNKWLNEVQQTINENIFQNEEVFLTGFKKDSSSYYLDYFPTWKTDFYLKKIDDLDAKSIRKEFFLNDYNSKPESAFLFNTTSTVNKFLYSFSHENKSKNYLHLKEEMEFTMKYREQFKGLKYNIPFLTGDSLVVCAGHVLLIKRSALPGKGLYALPGGFVDAINDADQIETAIRKLKEETKIDVPMPVLRGSIKKTGDFSNPERSLNWRIFTKAVLFQLQDKFLPKVKSGTDVEKVFWMPISQVVKNRDKFFEDHFHIIDTLLSI